MEVRSRAGSEGGDQEMSAGWRAAALLAILLGVGLRLWQYFANPSLWVDEAAVARNVLDRGVVQLLGRLDYGQVAPPGFLLGVKLSAALFGGSEYALRLVPLFAGLAGLFLFYFVAREILRPVGTIVATVLFSLAVPLIFFSANLKQYSSDVAVTLLVLAFALRIRRSILTLGSAGAYVLWIALCLFLSQAVVFATTIAGAVLLVDALVQRRSDRRLRFALVGLWALAVLAAVAHGRSVLSPMDETYLHRFWASGFLPRHGTVAWVWATARSVFAAPPNPYAFDGSLHYAMPVLIVLLVVIGAAGLCLRRPVPGA